MNLRSDPYLVDKNQYGLLEKQMKTDYRFTIYNNDRKGNLKIELYSNDVRNALPHIFKYNRETDELSHDSIQMGQPVVEFSENQELQNIKLENDFSGNKELFEQLKKLFKKLLSLRKI